MTCFCVRKGYRGRGITYLLARAAAEHAREQGATAVEGGPASSQEALLQSVGGAVPPEMEVVTGADRTNPGSLSYYLVRKVAPVTGRDCTIQNSAPSWHHSMSCGDP